MVCRHKCDVRLLNLVPRYLPRYGMAPEWAKRIQAFVVLFTFINILVTAVFRADVQLKEVLMQPVSWC